MIEKIEIYWGSDNFFEKETEKLKSYRCLVDVFNYLKKIDIKVEGAPEQAPSPLDVENLIIHTDDYGSANEWVILGFSNNILENPKLAIKNVWMCNPPQQILEDVKRTYSGSRIKEHHMDYPPVTEESLQKIVIEYPNTIIGQPHIVKSILPAIYALQNPNRKRPVTLLFLGDSGIGKTETANFIGKCIENEMVRIQFSMQQTNNAGQYIFGGEHGEDSFARCLIRRKSNLVLLDEFDKVSPVFYNAFYQMFDEGLFVDRNYKVDVSRCIIICTSNYKSEKDAEKNLGTPIYSRFSKVIKFRPISIDDKIRIAQKVYSSLFQSLKVEDQNLISTNAVLQFYETAIQEGKYPNIRMLKNDMEEALYYEILHEKGIL